MKEVIIVSKTCGHCHHEQEAPEERRHSHDHSHEHGKFPGKACAPLKKTREEENMLLDTLKTVLSVYGPTGREGQVAETLQNLLKNHVDAMRVDVMGNLIVEKKPPWLSCPQSWQSRPR